MLPPLLPEEVCKRRTSSFRHGFNTSSVWMLVFRKHQFPLLLIPLDNENGRQRIHMYIIRRGDTVFHGTPAIFNIIRKNRPRRVRLRVVAGISLLRMILEFSQRRHTDLVAVAMTWPTRSRCSPEEACLEKAINLTGGGREHNVTESSPTLFRRAT